MSNQRILFVDDDANLLGGIKRQQGDEFDLTTALGGEEALQLIDRHGPFAVVVSDMRMPVMNGIELLKRIRKLCPDTVRIMFTGFAELDSTIEAINEGHLFRFLAKPCTGKDLAASLHDALRQHALIEAERELVEGTLHGSVKVLSEVLGLVSPLAFGQSTRVRAIVDGILKRVPIPNQWQLEIAAMLSSLGCVTLPTEVLEKKLDGGSIAVEEERQFAKHPKLAADLLKAIPRMEQVSRIIQLQNVDIDVASVDGIPVPIESRVLKLAIDFDFKERFCDSPLHALNELKENRAAYDPTFFAALEDFVKRERNFHHVKLNFHEVVQGMVLAEDIRCQTGTLLMSKGQRLTGSAIRLLENFYKNKSLSGPLKVIVRSDAGDVEHEFRPLGGPSAEIPPTPEIPLPPIEIPLSDL
ncbi:HD domain-containing phosphohydrolase [Rhodopirellula sp. JC639]|uniref:HD domain-containing phosphohydrolase n=1 Tax=Stieleria mannarensis TaxID=2755585 RepID=UPI00160494AB|nr:HD domain-containing phosphohydrolase [Rhodopirellula sp. JC639]